MPAPYQLELPILYTHEHDSALAPAGVAERGSVFTRHEVVAFILDLIGYTSDQNLATYRLLEPAMGQGNFLLPAVERLLTTEMRFPRSSAQWVADLSSAIRAVEIDPESYNYTRQQLKTLMMAKDLDLIVVEQLLDQWLINDDFLLVDLPYTFTHITGNPPYVRHENIPASLMTRYRARYHTMSDRADLYIAFLERSLTLLQPDGSLGVICADRWMKNTYGARLRAMISASYHLVYYIDMVDTPAFLTAVAAYPAITVIRREPVAETRVARRPLIDVPELTALTQSLQASAPSSSSGVTVIPHVPDNDAPWILHDFDIVSLIRRLEKTLPSLEEAGCRVGIGVATGADRVYIGRWTELDVESDCTLPLARTKDLVEGQIQWCGQKIINLFLPNGRLINLNDYPRLREYLEIHREYLMQRACVRHGAADWYRTIDRIYPELTHQPKLLIPDIKGHAQIVYDPGFYYPHHNLYHITTRTWDLPVLQQVLHHGIAMLFVSLYSTAMRGGYVRFQAQYLRRIRLPRWEHVDSGIKQLLIEATASTDHAALQTGIAALYGLSHDEYQRIITYTARKEQ